MDSLECPRDFFIYIYIYIFIYFRELRLDLYSVGWRLGMFREAGADTAVVATVHTGSGTTLLHLLLLISSLL